MRVKGIKASSEAPALETDLGADLQPSRAAAPEEGIADAHIAGGCNSFKTDGPAIWTNALRRGIGKK